VNTVILVNLIIESCHANAELSFLATGKLPNEDQ